MAPQLCRRYRVCRSLEFWVISKLLSSGKPASAGRSQKHLWHGLLFADEYGRAHRAVQVRTAHNGGLSLRHRAGALRARGQHCDHRRASAMVARQSRNYRVERRCGESLYAPSKTTVEFTSFRRSPDCTPLTGKRKCPGVIAGLTRYANKAHLARAVLEATAFQSREVVEAMEQDSNISPGALRGWRHGQERTSMQFQADILNREAVRPLIQETTALGGCICRGSSGRILRSR